MAARPRWAHRFPQRLAGQQPLRQPAAGPSAPSGAATALAFAAPAVASASVWEDEWEPLPEGTQVHLSAVGTAEFNTFPGTYHCETAGIDFTIENVAEQAHGQVTAFMAGESADCHGSGAMAGCTFVVSELTEPATITGETIEDFSTWTEFGTTPKPHERECAVAEWEMDFASEESLAVDFETPDTTGAGNLSRITITNPNGGVLTAVGLEIPGIEIETAFTVEETCVVTHGEEETHIEEGCDDTFKLG